MIDRYDDRKQYKERKNKNIEEIIKMQREREVGWVFEMKNTTRRTRTTTDRLIPRSWPSVADKISIDLDFCKGSKPGRTNKLSI